MPCTNKVAIDDFLELLIETADKNKKMRNYIKNENIK